MDNIGNTELNYCYSCMAQMASGLTVCPVCGHDNRISLNPESTLPEGTILAGKYLVGKMLGQGGFGITYLGVNIVRKERVAIKEYFPAGIAIRTSHSTRVITVSNPIKAEGFRRGCEEFQAEAQRLAQFDEAGIVKVREYFRENGTAYIVMNYLDGNSLSEEAAACGGKIPWQRVLSLFAPLIPDIDKLHAKHLIHRDIKPDNIKVVREPGGGERLVLLDFGSARSFVSSEVTQTYTAMITKGYAPYEQYMSHARQGPYTDVYSLCATMYAVITGVVPPAATDRMLDEVDVVPIRSLGIPVPENVERAILHGLAVRSTERTQTMRVLYRELYGDPAEKDQAVSPDGQADPGGMNDPADQEDDGEDLLSSGPDGDPEEEENGGKSNKAIWILIPLLLVLAAGLIFILYKREQIQIGQAAETSAAETQVLLDAARTKAAEPTATPTDTPTPAATPTPEAVAGSIITLGHYEQDGSSDGAEAIEWQVLAVENGRALVISRYGLDAKPYNDKKTSVTWETCSLRAWLNGEFYNSAFSSEEKGRIREVTLKNPDNAKYGTNGGKDTTDRIFLLSIDEVNKYFANDAARQCLPTTNAKNNGSFVSGVNAGITWWWLRSPGSGEGCAADVNADGKVYVIGSYVYNTNGAVRPAFWLDL